MSTCIYRLCGEFKYSQNNELQAILGGFTDQEKKAIKKFDHDHDFMIMVIF